MQAHFIPDTNYNALVEILTLGGIITADQVVTALGERANIWPLSVAPEQPDPIEQPVDDDGEPVLN